MEYRRFEKFQMSPYFTASTPLHNGTEGAHKSNKSTAVLGKSPTQLLKEDRSREKLDESNVALNLCPNGSKIDISINGTTLAVTKTSLTATIGNFTISINCNDACTLTKEDKPLSPVPPKPTSESVLLTSFIQQNPLHAVLEDPAHIKATLPLTKVISDPNAHLVHLHSNGQGEHYLSVFNNAYYVAIDSDNKIRPLPRSQLSNANTYTFKQEGVTNVANKIRYYLETGGNKYYLTVTSDGDVTTLHANDLMAGTLNDLRSGFRHVTCTDKSS